MNIFSRQRKAFLALSDAKKRSSTGRAQFIDIIMSYYKKHKRPFAWRDNDNPYFVFVSEVMLQQTQTSRVIDKYAHFVRVFPTWQALADAPLVAVLQAWQGLGYNRRGKWLQQSAQMVVTEFGGILPHEPIHLIKLPGIGPATAASVSAFAYNQPTIFIETNIRAVFIHFFFSGRDDVHDSEIFPLIEQTLDRDEPRQWYYALMDYGVMLKKQLVNPSRKSKHHTKQSKFEGSDRQIRGLIVRLLTTQHAHIQQDLLVSEVCLHPKITADEERVHRILEGLLEEGMVKRDSEDKVYI